MWPIKRAFDDGCSLGRVARGSGDIRVRSRPCQGPECARAEVIANIPATRCQSSLETAPFQCQIVPSTVVTVTSALKPFSEPLPPVNWQAPSTSGTPLTRQWPKAVPPPP